MHRLHPPAGQGVQSHPSAPRRAPWITRCLRYGPLAAATGWLALRLANDGAPDADARIALLTLVVALAVATGSGAYERTRAFIWLRCRIAIRLEWRAFDRARAEWARRRRR